MTTFATPEEVLNAHLKRSCSGKEEEFLSSYREESFIITSVGVFHGLDGIRKCHHHLTEVLPNARYEYKIRTVEQDVGFLEWTADSDTHRVLDGADSYIIQDGYIRAQTIHYTLIPKNGG